MRIDDMNKNNFLRNAVLSILPLVCAFSFVPTQAVAQNAQQAPEFAGAHLQYAVFDGSTQAGWYSFPGQSPKLHFKGDEVRITSQEHSTVLLSRAADTAGLAAEVSLTRAPISTSSISGLAVLSDAQHALVIGLEGGSVVLWQLDPGVARIVARQPVNASSPLEFRVAGGNAADVRFFWRHTGDGAWHPLGDSESNKILASWREPLRFGLLLDGPQGSQVTFSNYRAASSNLASNSMPAMLDNGE
jgi:hypothetical protein